MEPIRININKQLNQESLVPVIAYPAESAYDFRLRNCKADMANISTDKAYRINIYPDGQNMQVSVIKTIADGFLECAILVNVSQKTIDGNQLLDALDDLAKAYAQLPASTTKPRENNQFATAVKDIHSQLTANAKPGAPAPLPVAKPHEDSALTYYMNYKTRGEIATLLRFPDQKFFQQTSLIYLVGENVHPVRPQACKHIHTLVLRTFKILSPKGYEYGEVKEGETTRISLKGKEGMLPMTINVQGDVAKPSRYGYYDSSVNAIRIDERTIKFYYELKFFVKHNGRHYRSSIVRYNGEQVMPDANGCYLIKVYEDNINDAGLITFTGEGFKDARIQVTPGIVKQQEYVFYPEPQHDITHVTLDFSDGRPIEASVDVGTNERLFNQLKEGKVKGYKVKKEGGSYRMYIPRKLTQTSKNILRLFKFLAMVAFSLLAYAMVCWLATRHWPWPVEQFIPTEKKEKPKPIVSEEGVVTTMDKEDGSDVGIIIDERDQVTLEGIDRTYLQNNNVWRKDSIKSDKYMDVLNTIFNGRISEIRMKNYSSKVINNEWWSKIWSDVIIPNNIHSPIAREVFQQVITDDRNSLDVQLLYEKLSEKLLPTSDAIKPGTGTPATAPKPAGQPHP